MAHYLLLFNIDHAYERPSGRAEYFTESREIAVECEPKDLAGHIAHHKKAIVTTRGWFGRTKTNGLATLKQVLPL